MSILREYDPNNIAPSFDEAYLDITDYVTKKWKEKLENHLLSNERDEEIFSLSSNDDWLEEGSSNCAYPSQEIWDLAHEVLTEMRRKIYEKTKLTCSAGLAPNSMLAKYCTDLNKPDGQYMFAATSLQVFNDFVAKIPVRKICGIGPVQEQLLKALNITTCQDLWHKRDLIYLLFTPASVKFYLRVSLGVCSNFIEYEDEPRKSKGAEETFKPTCNYKELEERLKNISEEVAGDLKERKLLGKTITLKIKKQSFETLVRSRTIDHYTSDPVAIFNTAKSILNIEYHKPTSSKSGSNLYRLIGVKLSNLIEETIENKKQPQQITLFNFLKSGKDKSETNDISLCEPHHIVETKPSCSSTMNSIDIFNQSTLDSENQTENQMICPVCFKKYFDSIHELNEHIDFCLSRDLISELSVNNSQEIIIIEDPIDSIDKYENNQTKGRKRLITTPKKSTKSPVKCKQRKIDSYFN